VNLTSTPKKVKKQKTNDPNSREQTPEPERYLTPREPRRYARNYNPSPTQENKEINENYLATRRGNRSPSPPGPGTWQKFIRKKAPNGDNLFHHKLLDRRDRKNMPRFANMNLSAKDIAAYLTGTWTYEDIRQMPQGKETLQMNGIDSERKILLCPKTLEQELNIVEATKDGEHWDTHLITIPSSALREFHDMIDELHTMILPPLRYDTETIPTRHSTKVTRMGWAAKASIIFTGTRNGTERLIIIRTYEHGKRADTIAIPWILFNKFVLALERAETLLHQE
jgi:hypothetical protein